MIALQLSPGKEPEVVRTLSLDVVALYPDAEVVRIKIPKLGRGVEFDVAYRTGGQTHDPLDRNTSAEQLLKQYVVVEIYNSALVYVAAKGGHRDLQYRDGLLVALQIVLTENGVTSQIPAQTLERKLSK